jgi:hypothetical protein
MAACICGGGALISSSSVGLKQVKFSLYAAQITNMTVTYSAAAFCTLSAPYLFPPMNASGGL